MDGHEHDELEQADARGADLRTPALGVVAWLAALAGLHLPRVAGRRPGRSPLARWSCRGGVAGDTRRLSCWSGCWSRVVVAAGALLRIEVVRAGPLPRLAAEEVTARVRLELTGDPTVKEGRFSSYVLVRATATRVAARGLAWRLHQPVLVIAPAAVALAAPRGDGAGFRAAVAGRRGRPRRGLPRARRARGAGARRTAAARRRAGARRASGSRWPTGGPSRAPWCRRWSTVTTPGCRSGPGDRLPDRRPDPPAGRVRHQPDPGRRRIAGARAVRSGVRARGLVVVGAVGVRRVRAAGPAGAERAAGGGDGLGGAGRHGHQRSASAGPGRSGLAVLVAAAGRPVAGGVGRVRAVGAGDRRASCCSRRGWRDALAPVAAALGWPRRSPSRWRRSSPARRWWRRSRARSAWSRCWPTCSPRRPWARRPCSGSAAGWLASVWAPLGRLVGALAAWCAAWIDRGRRAGAPRCPSAAVGWGDRAVPLAGAAPWCCGWLALVLGAAVLRRRLAGLACCGAAGGRALLVPLPTPGWPPRGWVLVACDVGQGDGLVLDAGRQARPWSWTPAGPGRDGPLPAPARRAHGAAAGADPLPRRPRRRAGRRAARAGGSGAIEVTRLADPPAGVGVVRRGWRPGGRAGPASRRTARPGRVGPLTLAGALAARRLAHRRARTSPPNDASVVLLVETRGDPDAADGRRGAGSQASCWRDTCRRPARRRAQGGPPRQRLAGPGPAALARRPARGGLGRGGQRLRPPGAGHAAGRCARSAGMRVRRTDQDGDVAVVVDGGRLRVETRQPAGRPAG